MNEPTDPARVNAALRDLCVVLGICLDDHQRHSLLADPPTSTDAFADAAMRAERLDPEAPKWANLRREVCKANTEEALRDEEA